MANNDEWKSFNPPTNTAIPLREQCRVRRFYFFYHDIRAFTTSWLPQPLYAIYRLSFSLYILAWLIVDAVQNTYGSRYPIYISIWSYIVLTLDSLLWSILTLIYTVIAMFFKDKLKHALPSVNSNMTQVEYYRQDKIPWFIKIVWGIHTVAITAPVLMVIVYWGFEYDSSRTIDAATVHLHGVNLLLVFIDLWINRIPLLFFHFLYPMLYGVAYVIFMAIFWGAGGQNPINEMRYIYSIVDFSTNPGQSAGVCIVLIIVAGVVYMLWFVLGEIRDQIFKRIRCCFWNAKDTGFNF